MTAQTRRDFLRNSALFCAAAGLRPSIAHALPLGLPLGLQLYSLRDQLPKDYLGTLRQIASLGYREVEAAGFFHHSASEVKQAMDAAALHCVSAHYPSTDLHQRFDEILAFHKELGAHYIICSSPGLKDPSRLKSSAAPHTAPALTLDDWRWNAEQFNSMGQKVKAAGMQFGYHNHTTEFTKLEGVVPFDELLRLTDPSLVTFEMDCGWVTVGGADPVDYLHRYADRISMLHIKDFKHTGQPVTPSSPPPAAELGQGTVNFRAIFEAADKSKIKHYFVEQEEYDMPPFEALRVDAEYMKKLDV